MTRTSKWVNELIEVLYSLNKKAHLSKIYDTVEKRNNMNLTKRWKESIRKTLSDERNNDIFYSVEGLGKGYWGLK